MSACLSCSFSRLIQVVNVGQDLDLNGDYFLLLGRGETSGKLHWFDTKHSDPSTTAVKQVACLPV